MEKNVKSSKGEIKMDEVYLVIEHSKGVIKIPFKEIKDIDTFTMLFDNELELFAFLSNRLNFDIPTSQLDDIYVSYSYQSKTDDKTRWRSIPVKYSTDDYDLDDVEAMYAKYYQDNHTRILANTDELRHLNSDYIANYDIEKDNITDNIIALLVKAYFKDKSYMKRRTAYFRLKETGYHVKMRKKETVVSPYHAQVFPYDVSDEYKDTINDRMLEELSLHDIEELQRNSNPSLFDGQTNPKPAIPDLDEIMSLEYLTNMSIEELQSAIIRYGSRVGKK